MPKSIEDPSIMYSRTALMIVLLPDPFGPAKTLRRSDSFLIEDNFLLGVYPTKA